MMLYVVVFLCIGTPFQFQLPQGSLLKPTTSISPPPDVPLQEPNKSSSIPSSVAVTSLCSAAAAGRGNGDKAVSPSEVRSDFFRSQTPNPVDEQMETSSKESGTVSKGSGAPSNGSDTPSKGSGALFKGSEPLSRGSDTPSKGSVAPSKGSEPLSRGSKIPSNGSGTPSKGSGAEGANGPHRKADTVKSVEPTTSSKAPSIGAVNVLQHSGSSEGKFEMGVSVEEYDSVVDLCDSQPFPLVQVPSCSQFESSESSETFFKVIKPSLNQSAVSEPAITEEGASEQKRSLFSDVRASESRRQKLDIGQVGALTATAVAAGTVSSSISTAISSGTVSSTVSTAVTGMVAASSARQDKDPYEFDSQSQDTDMQTLLRRLQSKKKQEKQASNGLQTGAACKESRNVETQRSTDKSAAPLTSVRSAEESTPMDTSPAGGSTFHPPISEDSATHPVVVPSQNQPVNHSMDPVVHPPSGDPGNPNIHPPSGDPRNPNIHPPSGDPENPNIHPPSGDPNTHLPSSTHPPVSHTTTLNSSTRPTADRNSFHINLTTSTHPTSHHSPSVPSIRVSQSVLHSPHFLPGSLSSPLLASSPTARSRLPGHHFSSSPLASVDYVSPSRSISAEGLQELRRKVTEQSGREAELCELRYVRTVCTVIEERFICSELVENGVVVPGSGKSWPVSFVFV